MDATLEVVAYGLLFMLHQLKEYCMKYLILTVMPECCSSGGVVS